MTQVYSPAVSAILSLASVVHTLETEKAELHAIKRLQSLTASQQEQLGQIGSNLDACESVFEDLTIPAWVSPEVAGTLEKLRMALI